MAALTLQDLLDYASEKGFDPSECAIKVTNFADMDLHDVVQDNDEVWEPMIVLGYYPD